MKAKIDPLANDVNTTMVKIQNLTIDQLSRPIFTQLDQWQKDMHKFIDDIHQRKTKEIEEMLNKNKEKFDEHKRQQAGAMIKVQEGVKQLAEDGDVTFEEIESFENQLRKIETNFITFVKNFFSINTQSLPDELVTVSSKVNEPSEPMSITKVSQTAIRGKLSTH